MIPVDETVNARTTSRCFQKLVRIRLSEGRLTRCQRCIRKVWATEDRKPGPALSSKTRLRLTTIGPRSYRQVFQVGLERQKPNVAVITIHPKALAKLIGTEGKIDLIDVRPRVEFNRVHIRGARSFPLATLHPVKLLRDRVGRKSDPVFLICWNRARASMAAGLLREAGCQQPVVLDGGMELWEAQGLPVMHPIRFEPPVLAKALARTVPPVTHSTSQPALVGTPE